MAKLREARDRVRDAAAVIEETVDDAGAVANAKNSNSLTKTQDEPAGEAAHGVKDVETADQSPAEVSGAEIVESGEDTAPVVFSPASEPETVRLEGKDAPIAPPEGIVRPPINISRPPKRLPMSLKTRWLSLLPEVREGLIAREEQVDNNFKKYVGLRPFIQMAEANGTTLQKALESYSALETEIRKDPVEGVARLWAAMGVDPVKATTALAERFIPDAPSKVYEAGRLAGFQEGIPLARSLNSPLTSLILKC